MASRVQNVFELLSREFPTGARLVRTPQRTKYFGWVSGTHREPVIYVCTKNSAPVQVDTLLHEYAHCLSWTDQEHGRRWERAYGKVYRAWLRWGEP